MNRGGELLKGQISRQITQKMSSGQQKLFLHGTESSLFIENESGIMVSCRNPTILTLDGNPNKGHVGISAIDRWNG